MAESRASRLLTGSIGFTAVGIALAGVAVVGLVAGYRVGLDDVDGGPAQASATTAAPSSMQQSAQEQSPDRVTARHQVKAPGPVADRAGAAAPAPAATPSETLLVPPAASERTEARPQARQVEPEEGPPEIDMSGRFEPIPVYGDIRSVDFRNGFTYPMPGTGPLTVAAGRAETRPDGTRLDLTIDEVIYGDATGDGVDDAAVVFHFTDRWDTTISQVRLFAIRDGMLEDWGWTWSDYRSTGGITQVRIDEGLLFVDSITQDARAATTAAWIVQGPGSGLQREIQSELPLIELDSYSPGDVAAIPVRSGAARAVLRTNSSVTSLLSIESEAGWMLKVTTRSGDPARLRVWESPSGRLVGDVEPASPLHLGAAGTYVAETLTDGESEFSLEATDQRTMQAPQWRPRSRVALEEGPAGRTVRALWPEFTWAAGAADLEAVNATIRAFVDERQRRHQGLVDSTCEIDERAMFSLTYRLTLVSYDLVSIDFNEFVCMCESGDSNEKHVLTIDMNTGETLDLRQLTNSDSAEFRAAWWSEATRFDSYYQSDEFADREPRLRDFNPMSLSAYGLRVDAELETVDDSHAYASALMSFDSISDHLDPTIAMRAASGAAVALPIEDGCGC